MEEPHRHQNRRLAKTMKVHHISYCVPPTLGEDEAGRIERGIDALFGRKWEKLPASEDFSVSWWDGTVRTDRAASEVLDSIKKISPHIRVLIVPRDPEADWVCHPKDFRAELETVVDRGDTQGTTLRAFEVFQR